MSKRANNRIRLGLRLVAAVAAAAATGLSGESIDRESTYDAIIAKEARANALNPDFVKALIWRESSFRAKAVGRRGEIGLMQITIPAVKDWAKAKRRRTPTRLELFNPYLNIEIGAWYLARAERYWRHHEQRHILAICEYNAGRKGTRRHTTVRRDGSVDIHKQRLYNYVSSIVNQYYKYAAARRAELRLTRSTTRSSPVR